MNIRKTKTLVKKKLLIHKTLTFIFSNSVSGLGTTLLNKTKNLVDVTT
jgi:hypothetical protein